MKILGHIGFLPRFCCFSYSSMEKLLRQLRKNDLAEKNTMHRFRKNAIRFCLDESKSFPEQIDTIVFYDKPLLKFERLLETYYAYAPKGLSSFIKAIPVWLNEKLFFKRLIKKELKDLGFKKIPQIIFPEHHLSHAASAFYPSPFEESAILTIDGRG